MTGFDGATVDRTRYAVRRLLDGMAEGKEVREYLKRFGDMERPRFAIIKIGGGVLAQSRAEVASSLAFLQMLGLTPIVVHGAGPQLDDALGAAGVVAERIDGLRVTPDAAMRVVADVTRAESLALARALEAEGGAAWPVLNGAIRAEPVDSDRLGRVGRPVEADRAAIDAAIASGRVPIIPSLGETKDGGLLNVNADAAVQALAQAFMPNKVIFLTPTGGLLDANGQIVSVIQLAADYDTLMRADWLQGGMRLKLREIARLLDRLPATASVAITRPEDLARELFTHGGSGTLVRRGERLAETTRKDALDAAALQNLIESAFSRSLQPDWWPSLDVARVVYGVSMRAAAVLTRFDDDVLYLDKFAVLDEARGEGLGKAVWNRVAAAAPELVWRARADNGFNNFYWKEADGGAHIGPWTVFWRGFQDWATLGERIRRVATMPESFEAT